MSSSSNRESQSKDVKISPGAVVCVESKLKGSISVGSMTIIHPKASVIAEAGPVIIGENNIIEEQASIIYRSTDDVEKENSIPLNIGVNNVFEVGCEVHAKSIGDHNVFESKCYVGPNVEIGNGCIIGAGCRITVAERLPDLTVITGRECVRRLALDKPPGSEDLTRQLDELTVMSEIFTKEEFSNYSGDEVHAVFEAHIPLPSGFTLSLSQESGQTSFPISHLPPIRLVASLPNDYPSVSRPDLSLSCCWLGKSKLESLILELDKLWNENQCEILFIWCSFLKDQSLDLLNITNSYNLSEKDPILRPDEKETCNLQTKRPSKTYHYRNTMKDERNNNRFDPNKRRYGWRKKYCEENDFLREKVKAKLTKETYAKLRLYHNKAMKQLFFYMIDYNASKAKEEFNKSMQDCNVCFCQVMGEQCRQLNCSHITCLECLKRLCQVHIQHGTMESIVCPQEDCGLELPANLIQELVSKEIYERYDRLMLNRTLDKISNMTYCPRQACQYPISTQDEESLAVCPSCSYAFCVYCKRVYHGIEGCKLKSEEKSELVEAYKNADHAKRLELEKRYGKKQLMELVCTAETEAWMSQNSKQCPCCNINIEKSDGCNKMICRKCNTNFCWLCLTRVSSLNPYLHFQDPKSRCYNLLFEGTFQENVNVEQEVEEEEEVVPDEGSDVNVEQEVEEEEEVVPDEGSDSEDETEIDLI